MIHVYFWSMDTESFRANGFFHLNFQKLIFELCKYWLMTKMTSLDALSMPTHSLQAYPTICNLTIVVFWNLTVVIFVIIQGEKLFRDNLIQYWLYSIITRPIVQ